MRRTTSAVLGLLACPALSSAQNFDDIQIRTVRVTESIYMLQGSGGNIGVSIGDDGTFIVDDQFAPLTEKITAAIAELTDNPVDFVINTHWHYDHTDGNENFGRAGAIIVAQENSRRRMETDQIVSLSNRLQEAYSKEGLPKITFGESIRFHYNDNQIDIVHFGPAHTDGDAVVFFRDSNVIHTGDVFVRYGLPFIDGPNGGAISGMIDALWGIAGLIGDDTTIIPGHGQLSTRTELLEYRSMLVTIRQRIRAHIAEGLSVDEVVAANPARGFAEPGAGTERWVRAAYEDLR
ncbi:MAG: MBL fold metallo-hydrolase [Gemmatimonadetes bacterium]|nr:MBL fold metallo-hydrolase [Gemmatimonadota bacterium]